MSSQFKLKHRIFSEALEARVLLSDVAWSRYLGGSERDESYATCLDADGNAWVTGQTASSGWTVGGFDTSFNGGDDAFVAKINANGTLAWSSYLGGDGSDYGYGISVDADGNAWVTGYTESSGWTVGGFDTSYNGSIDAFVAKINANGTLAWSSYLGGGIYDFGYDISVDADGNAWVTGKTLSSGWTVGGFDTSQNGDYDAFVAKINANGTLAWSSYLGGDYFDYGYGISVDADGNAWVTGSTGSSGWTVGGFDTIFNGGSKAFVAKINANGTLAWSSYLGGDFFDYGYGIFVDADGNAWVTGETVSSGWTVGGFDTSHNGDTDAFVAKINANGTLAWSSYLGGSSSESGRSISVDANGNAWVTGKTDSSGWAIGGFNTSHNGNDDAFIAKINADGTLAWTSYLGGDDSDVGYGISLDADGNAWVTGKTESSNWTVGGFHTSYNDGGDAFVAKISNIEDSFSPLTINGANDNDSVSIARVGNLIETTFNGVIYNRSLETISSINITTGNGNDTITIADDVMGVTIDAAGGNDRIITGDSADSIRGGPGNDYIVANEGNDTVYGRDGKDTLTGSAGRDKLYGENGEDRINGGKGNDTIFGGSGDDRMYGNEDNDSIDGGGNIDRAWGGVGNDTLIGGGSNDKLYGEGGNDRFYGNAGADLISGGSGTDAAKDEDDGYLYLSIESYF